MQRPDIRVARRPIPVRRFKPAARPRVPKESRGIARRRSPASPSVHIVWLMSVTPATVAGCRRATYAEPWRSRTHARRTVENRLAADGGFKTTQPSTKKPATTLTLTIAECRTVALGGFRAGGAVGGDDLQTASSTHANRACRSTVGYCCFIYRLFIASPIHKQNIP